MTKRQLVDASGTVDAALKRELFPLDYQHESCIPTFMQWLVKDAAAAAAPPRAMERKLPYRSAIVYDWDPRSAAGVDFSTWFQRLSCDDSAALQITAALARRFTETPYGVWLGAERAAKIAALHWALLRPLIFTRIENERNTCGDGARITVRMTVQFTWDFKIREIIC
jgi:hypothetical protein